MKIIRYLSDPIKNLYNRMGRKLKFAGWLVYDTNGTLPGADATDIMAP